MKFATIRFSAVIAAIAFAAAPLFSQTTQQYQQTNLVSSTSGVASNSDSNLINPWGISRSSAGPWWVSDNGNGLSTLYAGTGSTIPLVVTIPPATPQYKIGSPTGTIFNGTSLFDLAPGAPAFFLFATEDGTISGWNPSVNKTSAVIVVNTKGASSFKGITSATISSTHRFAGTYLYAADFLNGRIDVFNSQFQQVPMLENRFNHPRNDGEDNESHSGFAPFNIQNIGGNIYVTYAANPGHSINEMDGTGLGDVVVFSPSGKELMRFQHGPWFNAPWGITQASSDFGAYSHDILVGQFGSGEIAAFNPVSGRFEGMLMNSDNQPIQVSGLWGLSFGNGATAGPATALYFAAGSDNENGGLLGEITAIQNTQGNDQ
jgi:uncharacterized protein (TIGR03118 family)